MGAARIYLWALLLPLSFLFAGVARLRRAWPRRAFRPRSFVISVGNLHSGGSGKTPVTRALARHFEDRGSAIVLRGYGRRHAARVLRVTAESSPAAVGDEAAWLAAETKSAVWVAADRARAVAEIEREATIRHILLDDGFQHLRIARDLDLVLINCDKSWRENFLLPLGELREPFSALRRASALVLYFGDATGPEAWARVLEEVAPQVPRFYARRRLGGGHTGATRAFAFCGIGNPPSFFSDLRPRVTLVGSRAFPDHHLYSPNDLREIQRAGREVGADWFLTTEKDRVRLGADAETFGGRLAAVPMEVEFDPGFLPWLDGKVAGVGGAR